MSDKKTEEMGKIADKLISRYSLNNNVSLLADAEKNTIKEYIMGSAKLDELYSFADNMPIKWWHFIDSGIFEFDKTYNDEEFFRRCMVVNTLMQMGNEVHRCLIEHENWQQFSPEKIEKLFADYEKEELMLKYQLYIIDIMEERGYKVNDEEVLADALRKVFTRYLDERREETLEAFAGASALARWFALTVLAQKSEENKSEIISYAQDGSGIVRNLLFDMLCERKDWAEDIKRLAISKKLAERELAARVLIKWHSSGIDCAKTLFDMLEKEKSAKLAALIRNSISENTATGESADKSTVRSQNEIIPDELVKQLHKGGRKRSLEWAYQTSFGAVHKNDGTVASEEYMQAFLLCYSTADKNGISASGALLADSLREDELAAYVNELYSRWLSLGADTKKRWVLYTASIHGGSEIVDMLVRQIGEWAQNLRGAIAAEAVKALALNPFPNALLTVDGMARKYKFKQVKAAAGEAMEYAAEQLGITREELADKIVPDLGFDENMERIFDYGERKFKVTLTPALEAEVFDETGKKLKNLPSVGKKDDEEKARAAIDAFKQLKKQMKASVSSQKARMEYALMAKREWTADAWRALFVKNPIMHQFAIGLIWGVYEEGKLIKSFRYMEDGSFNTEDEEEYILPDGAAATCAQTISLVHPIELTDVSLSKWRQQLEDYEIIQPITQLYRQVYRLTDAEKEMPTLERFGGIKINDLSLMSRLTGAGWYRGSVQDAGGFYTFYREDIETGLGVELHFSGSFVGSGYGGGEEITVYDARFYKAGTIERGSYCYDEAEGDKIIPLKDIPPRYFSEIALQLANATASSNGYDESWKSSNAFRHHAG